MEHGKMNTYNRGGCRCDLCRAAATAHTMKRRRRERATKPLVGAELDALPMLGEVWRGAVGNVDYEVSNFGRVRSLKYTNPRLISQAADRNGYHRVRLYAGNRLRYRFVHALVAEAFIGPRPDGLEVRHRDDDKAHNSAANLMYGTRSENILDAVRNGKQHQASKTHCPQGHPYDATNTRIRPNGNRVCRACERARTS